MEIESLHKYISLVKLPNNTVEVSFSGQLCLTVSSNQFETIDSTSNISENHYWRINPIFAKLVYGANIFSDIPYCNEQYSSIEDAISGGLVKLHELGAFNSEVDLPEDTYAATISSISEDARQHAIKNTKSLMEALSYSKKLVSSIYDGTFMLEDRESRSEFSANLSLRGITPSIKSKTDPNKHKIKDQYGFVVSSHETESGAISAFNNLQNKRGMKLVKESDETEIDITPAEIVEKKLDIFSRFMTENSLDGTTSFSPVKRKFTVHYTDETGKDKKYDKESYSPRKLKRGFDDTNQKLKDITHNGKSVMNENSDDDYAKWEDEVKKTHSTKKLKFKGRVESGVDTISAEEPGIDRSYGVWDNKTNKGHVFKHED